jgi:hypothetical protein
VASRLDQTSPSRQSIALLMITFSGLAPGAKA